MDKVLKDRLIWLPELSSLRKLVKRIFEEHNIAQMVRSTRHLTTPAGRLRRITARSGTSVRRRLKKIGP